MRAGARVALVAPAGVLRGEEEVAQSIANARSFGWEPVVGEHVLARAGYLAGTDNQRIDDMNNALSDPMIDAIWCVRGGYGTMRILQHLDYDALTRKPRPLIGFSDVTALHAAIGKVCGVQSYHGPTARGSLSSFSRQSLERAVIAQVDSCGSATAAR